MSAVIPRPTTRPQRDRNLDCDLCTWVLSVQDWQVHALAAPCSEAWGVRQARCGVRQPMGCPVSVAHRDEICPRCAAGGVELLELLPDQRP